MDFVESVFKVIGRFIFLTIDLLCPSTFIVIEVVELFPESRYDRREPSKIIVSEGIIVFFFVLA